jgi:hypothetical protein
LDFYCVKRADVSPRFVYLATVERRVTRRGTFMHTPLTLHVWSHCHNCGMNPIVGTCYRCETCALGPDIDLCLSCYEGYREGRTVHPGEEAVGAIAGIHRFAGLDGTSEELLTPWLGIGKAPTCPPPAVPSGFLVRPEFRSGPDSVFGGYAFVVWFHGHALLVTGLHVMDELIKRKGIDTTARNPDYTGTELPAELDSVRLYDVLKHQWPLYELGSAGPMLVLPNARTADDEPFASRDIAAFQVASSGLLKIGYFAEEDPSPGDPVWLAAAMPDGSRTRRAVCVEKTARTFIFRYEEAKALPSHSSGAPILDSDGAVVGINTGLGRFGNHDFGHANPLSSIRNHLEGAL